MIMVDAINCLINVVIRWFLINMAIHVMIPRPKKASIHNSQTAMLTYFLRNTSSGQLFAKETEKK